MIENPPAMLAKLGPSAHPAHVVERPFSQAKICRRLSDGQKGIFGIVSHQEIPALSEQCAECQTNPNVRGVSFSDLSEFDTRDVDDSRRLANQGRRGLAHCRARPLLLAIFLVGRVPDHSIDVVIVLSRSAPEIGIELLRAEFRSRNREAHIFLAAILAFALPSCADLDALGQNPVVGLMTGLT